MEPSSQVKEGGEQKFVTLETGSKLSGYTQDYLERLCRLKKVDYRIWNNGQFVIELESLLQETQTILLSHDGISFVDKGELADPVPEVVGSMLSSALKEVKTSIAMPDTVPSAPLPAMPEEVLPAAPAAAVTPQSIPTGAVSIPAAPAIKEEVSATPVIPHVPMTPPPSVGASPAPTPMMGRTPIATAPLSMPKPPRPIKINTAVETVPLEQASPLVQSSPMVTAPLSEKTEVAQEPVSVPTLEQKELPVMAPESRSGVMQEPVTVPDVAPIKQSIPFGSLPEQSTATQEQVVAKEVSSDDWDALLLGGVSDVVESPTVTPQVISQSASPVASPYHPIQTSVDPRPHHDDSPLFPVLNPKGVTKPVDSKERAQVKESVAPQVAAPISAVNTPSANQRVIVFEPGELLQSKAEEHPAQMSTVAPVAVPEKQGVINHEPLPVPEIEVPATPPVVPVAVVRKTGSVPSLRVMPVLPVKKEVILPMRAEEHHLILQEEHSLMKSTGLNLAFAAVVIGSSMLLWGSTFMGVEKKLGDLGTTSYVAGVGAAFDGDESNVVGQSMQKKNEEFSMPFSDEVIVDLGSKANSVIVRPVFKAGLGNAYEYAITPIAATSSPVTQ